MDAAGEDRSDHDPEVDDRSPKGAGERSEDRSEPRDVEQLDQKNFPRRKHHEVDAVGFGDGGSGIIGRRENVVDDFRVDRIAGNQAAERNQKRNHRVASFSISRRNFIIIVKRIVDRNDRAR